MQATARRLSVVSATSCARRRLIRSVRLTTTRRAMRKPTCSIVISVILSLAIVGCTPLPSTTPVFPRLSGVVTDSETHLPVPRASIHASRAGYVRKGVTSRSGHFTLSSAKQWHYLVYIGSPGVAPLPWPFRHGLTPLIITASAPGYESASQTFQPLRIRALFSQPLETLPDRIDFSLRPER